MGDGHTQDAALPYAAYLEGIADPEGDGLAARLSALRSERYNQADAALLETESRELDPEHIACLENGRFHSFVGSARFECFYHDSPHEYLYVVLDTMRDDKTLAEGPLPRFPKWSWYPLLQGHLLSIEDPLYFESDTPVGWFYGSREEDYREATARLVGAVARHLGIPNERVIFYAISSGGTSGLFVASKLPGSTAIASNPQLDLTRFQSFSLDDFKTHTGIDLHDEKVRAPERVDFGEVVKAGGPSKYLVIVNCRSKMDYDDQLVPFCKKLGVPLRYGLQRFGNLALWVIDAPGKHPHLCYESKPMYFAIDHLAKTLASGSDVDALEPLYTLLGELWHEKAGLLAGDPDVLAAADPLSNVRGG